MLKQSLNGEWNLEIVGESAFAGEKLSVNVPGSVYSALLNADKMPDPYWRANELEALKIMDNDFVFTRVFDLKGRGTVHLSSPEIDAQNSKDRETVPLSSPVLLVCEGLDTLCEVELNGEKIGYTDNMHRRWEFDITEHVKESGNELKIRIASPTKYIAEKYNEVAVDGATDAMLGFPHIRKTHCMYGWDWGPRLPDAGIWRDIYIAYPQKASLDSVYVSQNHHEDGKVKLSFDVDCVFYDCSDDWCCSIDIIVTAPDGAKQEKKGVKCYSLSEYVECNCLDDCSVVIENPQLWWPNGYGKQPLYNVVVSLKDKGGSELDCWERRIGLRTLTVSREKDKWGESFAFCVNGVKVFARGADYIPEDNIFPRITTVLKRRLLEDSVLANFNTIRVWGGGYYPGNDFYDICDELGIMVWQDFMFACAIYELTPELEKNIRAEVRDNVKRLRHHASLALWCGNNEIEWQQAGDSFKRTPKQKADYIRMFGYIIPQEVEAFDPQRFFWPSSPSSGGDYDEPNSDDRGNVHNWEVWHELKPFSEYRKRYSRFISEFGFQSFPCLKTVEAFTLPEDRNIFSRTMEMHQRNGSANGRIMYYMSSTYRYPTHFEHLLYASQLLQAEAIRYGVEHWRRNRERCMGTIFWQLNDIWPVASWASIDYYGRWKALHYFAKRFFAPIAISCLETGEMTERPNCVAQPAPIKKGAKLSVVNETMSDVKGVVNWTLRDAAANVVKSGRDKVHVKALSALWLYELDFSDCDELSEYFSYELETDGEIVSSGTVLFSRPKHFDFQDPKLAVSRKGDSVTVSAQAYAKNVEIYADTGDDDFMLSDNYFDMNAGSLTVQILRGNPKNLKARSVYDIGRYLKNG